MYAGARHSVICNLIPWAKDAMNFPQRENFQQWSAIYSMRWGPAEINVAMRTVWRPVHTIPLYTQSLPDVHVR